MTTDPHALIAEAEALAAKATPGPWANWDNDHIFAQRHDGSGHDEIARAAALPSGDEAEREANGDLIAASRTLVPALCAALRQALAENERLRAALAQSDSPCAYCTLPADRWAECAHGFPGCARADDAMGCPELGARLELDQLRAEVERLSAPIEVTDEMVEAAARAATERSALSLGRVPDWAEAAAQEPKWAENVRGAFRAALTAALAARRSS